MRLPPISYRPSSPAEDARLRHLARSRGASVSEAVREIVEGHLSKELAPEAFVLDQIHQWESLTVRVAGGEVLELTPGQPRTEILGKPLAPPQPLEQFVRVEAHQRDGRTVIELVALPGEFDGVRVYVATIPAAADVTLTVQLQDLYPAEQLPLA